MDDPMLVRAYFEQIIKTHEKPTAKIYKDFESTVGPLLANAELTDPKTFFTRVMQSVFSDGRINWGRLLTLFLFGRLLAQKTQNEDLIEVFIEQILENIHVSYLIFII